MTAGITPATRVFALLGNPVAHSLSPRMQNAAISAAGVDGVYVALRCDASDVAGLIGGLARANGGGNVTVPHKEVAARVVERPSEAVVRTGACNTFWLEDGHVHGDNTDVTGFARAVESLLGASPTGARVLLVGAGGGAAAVAEALRRADADEVVVVNRSLPAARELVDRFDTETTRFVLGGPLSSLVGEAFDLAVNATSLGLRADDPMPVPVDRGPTYGAAFDLVYRPGLTPWIREQRARGTTAADGLDMLVHQGAAAFTRWWGIEAPFSAMRSAVTER